MPPSLWNGYISVGSDSVPISLFPMTGSPENPHGFDVELSDNITILEFVKSSEVDPNYYRPSYYAEARDAGSWAYAELLGAMRRLKVAAIATFTINQQEQIVLVRPYDNGLLLHTLDRPDLHTAAPFGSYWNYTQKKAS
jgi:non-homologous end joining protein Ku